MAWTRLPDLPLSSGNFQTNGRNAFKDRYIILIGGSVHMHTHAHAILLSLR